MLNIYLSSLYCHAETNEVGPDEPFVLATSVDQRGGRALKPAGIEVVKYGPFKKVDKGDSVGDEIPGWPQSFWGPTGRSAPLAQADDAIFVIGLIENDDGDSNAARGLVKTAAVASIAASSTFNRATTVTNLIRDVDSAMGIPTGGPNFDEKVGGPQELRFSDRELSEAEAGKKARKTLVFSGDGGRYTLTFEARRAAVPVAAHAQDRWVFTMANRIMVVTTSGSVHAHDVSAKSVEASVQLTGPAVAANRQDKRVLVIGSRILVNTDDGRVFAHDITGTTIGVPFQVAGAKVGGRPQDKWVLTMGNRILVVTNNGEVHAHDVSATGIVPSIQLSGPPVGANSNDKRVFVVGSRILVNTNDGSVFGHDITPTGVGSAFQLSGPKVAANSQDKWLLVMGNRILIVTTTGEVHAHDVSGSTITNSVQLL